MLEFKGFPVFSISVIFSGCAEVFQYIYKGDQLVGLKIMESNFSSYDKADLVKVALQQLSESDKKDLKHITVDQGSGVLTEHKTEKYINEDYKPESYVGVSRLKLEIKGKMEQVICFNKKIKNTKEYKAWVQRMIALLSCNGVISVNSYIQITIPEGDKITQTLKSLLKSNLFKPR